MRCNVFRVQLGTYAAIAVGILAGGCIARSPAEEAISKLPSIPDRTTLSVTDSTDLDPALIRQTVTDLQAQAVGRSLNPSWDPALEEEFWQRAAEYFEQYQASSTVETDQDREKHTYAELMAAAIVHDAYGLLGDRQRLMSLLQAEDQQATTDHAHTEGIDYYWCFTLKQQMRKYFLLGDWLSPAYRDRMARGAKIWTETDPLPRFELIHALNSPDAAVRTEAARLLPAVTGQNFGQDSARWRAWWRPWAERRWQEQEEMERLRNPRSHPLYGVGRGGIGVNDQWGPEVRGSWVDGRNTANLRAMRDTSVYLMAEATGNELTRLLYKDKLRHFVWQLYQVGLGEWDSENYLSHSVTPFLNLHDFAQDPEVRLLSKAAIDWLLMSGALKYYQGGFGGPTLRDFGGATHVFGSSAVHQLYLYFGDAPLPDPAPHYDDIHTVTSTYRPPQALVELARKNFARPVELLNTKPHYDSWKPGNDEAPVFYETLFFGQTFSLGSAANAGAPRGLPFKLLIENRQRGADYFLAQATPAFHREIPGVQMGQYRNLLIWLRPNDGTPVFFQAPQTVFPDLGRSWQFAFEQTDVVVYPINLSAPTPATLDRPTCRNRCSAYYREQVLQADAESAVVPYVGFVLEVRDRSRLPLPRPAQGSLELSRLSQGTVSFAGTDGQLLSVTYNPAGLPTVIRDGEARSWQQDVYQAADSDAAPVQQAWKGGTLRVEAGGYRFEQTVTRTGEVIFAQTQSDRRLNRRSD